MNKVFKIRTKFGVTYNYIHSWVKWSLDENFIQCEWGDSTRGILILQIKDIEAIEGV
jgi:hypothetical protein